MTRSAYILPMNINSVSNDKPRRILFLVYDGFAMLDIGGPSSVFDMANDQTGRELYEVEIISLQGGLIRSKSGIEVMSIRTDAITLTRSDTVLITGADRLAIKNAVAQTAHKPWLMKALDICERLGSICTGSFILAAFGLLDKKNAVTHWAGCEIMARYYAKIRVDPDALYVIDGSLWTSAGGTSGVDMTLAMLARDHGPALMRLVAKFLVVYAHRPGNQSQFSTALAAQSRGDGSFADIIAGLDSRLHEDIRVADLAQDAGMSERSFYRKFTKIIGVSPAKFIETLRLEKACQLLEDGAAVKSVAGAVGFKSQSGFRNAFETRYALTPSLHRQMHAG
ncbi:MAG: helix-turn-helix domain-containing protein [Cohaesibacteraceae bacterium]|nr:helix-turn-helix domain-containing protein [Cohaesibacteraceae bacterium]